MNGNEIELKLALPAEALPRLKRLAPLRELRAGRPALKALRSIYYDTPTHDLARAGVTARIRHGNGGKAVQTVKTAGSRASGLFARQEWESAVAGTGLDRDQLLATGLESFRDPALVDALAPVFATEIRRSAYQLHGDGWLVEMAVDVGEVRAGDKAEPICEVELELKRGQAADLFRLAHQIARALPVRLLAQSKSDRGYDLAAGRAAQAVKARPVALDGDTTIGAAFRAIARNCLHHLLANQQSLLESGDGEAVHQMRVALRRLRSAMKIFRPLVAGPQLEALRGEMRWLLGQLGPARDADVFMTQIIKPAAAQHPGHPGMDGLRALWRRELENDVAAARAAAAEPRFALLLLDLGAWVEAGEWAGRDLAGEALRPFSCSVLKRLSRKLRQAGGKRLQRLSPPALHQVRIRGKQLRYAGEFFAPLFGKAAREPLALLGELQDSLGELNDVAVAVPRLAACHHLGETAWAAGMVAGWHEARRPALMAAAESLWKRWRRQDDFWA